MAGRWRHRRRCGLCHLLPLQPATPHAGGPARAQRAQVNERCKRHSAERPVLPLTALPPRSPSVTCLGSSLLSLPLRRFSLGCALLCVLSAGGAYCCLRQFKGCCIVHFVAETDCKSGWRAAAPPYSAGPPAAAATNPAQPADPGRPWHPRVYILCGCGREGEALHEGVTWSFCPGRCTVVDALCAAARAAHAGLVGEMGTCSS